MPQELKKAHANYRSKRSKNHHSSQLTVIGKQKNAVKRMYQALQRLLYQVSKTFVEGSNPSAPARNRSLVAVEPQGFSRILLQ